MSRGLGGEQSAEDGALSAADSAAADDGARPATRHVGVKDVARAAGVSPGTVSNVLNHPERVTPARRRRVEQAIEAMGFVRHESARHLRTGTTRTLGLLLLDAWNPFFTDMARGVEDWAFDRGLPIILSNSARRSERQSAYLQLFRERRVAGVILVPQGDFRHEVVKLHRQGIASVIVDRTDVDDTSLAVFLDDVKGGHLGMTHLLELGHRRIAFLGNPHTVAQVGDRLLGATHGISDFGAPVQLSVLEPNDLNFEAGRELGNRIVAMRPADRPTAAFAASDLVALGLLHSLQAAGIRVPQDISIVGYDDIAFAAQASVALTSVHQPAYDMGRTAAQMITSELAGSPPSARHVVFEPSLVVRDSTTAPPGEAPH